MDANADFLRTESLFKWETLREVGPCTLFYEEPIHGKILEVQLTSGPTIEVFRADDGEFYFCHGLTFGGKDAPGGAVSPFSGLDVKTIVANHYWLVDPESAAAAGDVLVWRGLGDDTPHSAVLTEPVVQPGKHYLAVSSKVRTKNGRLGETEMTIGKLTGTEYNYGDSFNVYRRKS